MANLKIETRVEKTCTGPELKSDVILTCGLDRYAVGGVAEGSKARKVFQGPLVEGPWHFIFGLAGCIAANPEHGTYGEMKRARAAGLVHAIAPGDLLLIDGIRYTVRASFNGVLEIE